MSILRSARRGAAAISVAILATAIVPAAAWGAGPLPTGGSSLLPTTTTTTLPAQTTTSTSTSTTTTTTPPTTRASTTTTTRPKTKSPARGVPSIPVGGPPTTKPRPGTPPPPPPDPGPILTAVDSDLSQLGAINEYNAAKTAVAHGQKGVVVAGALVQSAQVALRTANDAAKVAQGQVGLSEARLRGLALAAYMGIGYDSPVSTPGGVQQGSDTLGGLSGAESVDAQVMLQLVATRVRSELVASRKQLSDRQHGVEVAARAVAKAEEHVGTAQAALASDQRNLALVVKAATIPGAAGSLTVPGSANPGASATQTAAPGQQSSGAGSSTDGQPVNPAAVGEGVIAAGPLGSTTTTSTTLPASYSGQGQPPSPDILGKPILDAAQLAAWFASTGHKANVTVPMTKLAAAYEAAGKTTGVRYDIAFAQSVVETGYFSFPAYGQLTPAYNNFAGIGACDTCAHGWKFPNAKTGVAAQLELLEAYASPNPVPTPLIGNVGVGGCCPTWMALAGKWATSLVYGISIMTVYQQMLSWVIPQRLVQAGLIAPRATPATKGPTLAPLPRPAGN